MNFLDGYSLCGCNPWINMCLVGCRLFLSTFQGLAYPFLKCLPMIHLPLFCNALFWFTVMVLRAVFVVYNVVSSFHSRVLIIGVLIAALLFSSNAVLEASLLYLIDNFRDVLSQLGVTVEP